MAVIVATTTQIAVLKPEQSDIQPLIAAVDLIAGQPVHFAITGRVGLADADAAAPANTVRGIALQTASAGTLVDVLKRGHVAGFAVAALSAGTSVFVDNAGALNDVAGTATLRIGSVVALTDGDGTKVLYVDISW